MKKSLIFTVLILVCFNLNAQDVSTKFSGENSYGVKAGFTSFNIKASVSGVSVSEDASGFYAGFFASFSLSEKFEVQPELHVLSVYESGESSSVLLIPFLAKFNITEEFGVLAGPQLDIVLDEDTSGLKKTGLGLAAGLEYLITDNIFIDARYSFGLSDRLGDFDDDGEGIKLKFNYLQAGLGYRF